MSIEQQYWKWKEDMVINNDLKIWNPRAENPVPRTSSKYCKASTVHKNTILKTAYLETERRLALCIPEHPGLVTGESGVSQGTELFVQHMLFTEP